MAWVVKIQTENYNDYDFMAAASNYALLDEGIQISPIQYERKYTKAAENYLGEEVVEEVPKNREIIIKFRVSGTTRDNMAQNISNLHQAVRSALDGDIVTFALQLDGMTAPRYFRVITGEVIMPDNFMSVAGVHVQEIINGTLKYALYDMELKLEVKPSAFTADPDGGSLTSLPLNNPNGTNVTTGITIAPVRDTTSSKHSYAYWSSSAVGGDLPALSKITITTPNYRVLSVAMGLTAGANARPPLYADSAYYYADTTPTYETGNTSLLESKAVILNSISSTAELILMAWNFNPTGQGYEYMAGRPYRVFGIASDQSGGDSGYAYGWRRDYKYWLEFVYSTGGTIAAWQPPTIYTTPITPSLNSGVVDFGTVTLPQVPEEGINCYLKRRNIVASPYTDEIRVSGLVFIPQDLGYRMIKIQHYGADFPDSIVDDTSTGVESLSVIDNSLEVPAGVTLFNPIQIPPGIQARLDVFVTEYEPTTATDIYGTSGRHPRVDVASGASGWTLKVEVNEQSSWIF